MKKMLRGERRQGTALEDDGKFCNVAAAMIGSAVVGAGASAYSSNKNAKAAEKAGQLDPRVDNMLWGNGAQPGLLSNYQGMMNDPRSDAANSFAGANANYLTNNGAGDMNATRDAALKAMQGNQAPMSQAAQAPGMQPTTAAQSGGALASLPAYAVGNMVDAPSQNGLNLSGSYNSLINGAPGANPYLTGAVQKGINQSQNAFGNMVTDAKAATQDVLGSIRGNSVLAGQFGGSRQGIAEGKAIDSMNTNLSRAASQFGQNNTDAAVAAQAGAYNTDRDRQLAATQGLGAQQYGVAQQNAATKNTAEFINVGNTFDASKTNAGMAQQNSQFNAGLQQQTGQYNANMGQNNNQFNAGLAQQTGLANQQSQLSTNGQNNGQLLSGAGLLAGMTSQASGQVNANDNWKLNQTQAVNSMLQPYLSGIPTQQPVYSNTAGAAVGGGLAGLQFGSQLAGMFGGSSTDYSAIRNSNGAGTPVSAGNYGLAPSNLPVQQFGYGR